MNQKFLILDRDGTINTDIGYTHKIKDLKIMPRAIEGLKKFRDAGFKFIVITNQGGIAKNIFTPDDLNKFNAELLHQLENHDIEIEKIYHCPHHPDLTGKCWCRKPNVGMIKLAEQEFGFNSSESIFIGDRDSDIELGNNCQGTTVLIKSNQYPYNSMIKPHFEAKNLSHAFDLLRSNKVI